MRQLGVDCPELSRKAAYRSFNVTDKACNRVIELVVSQGHKVTGLGAGFPEQKRDRFKLLPGVVLFTDQRIAFRTGAKVFERSAESVK